MKRYHDGMDRRAFLVAATAIAGCGRSGAQPDLLWGKRGVVNGDFVRPRAIAILPGDRLYIVDFTARIQAYDADGQYLGITWQTPDYRNGRPSGLSVSNDGNLIVSDSHYFTVRVYTPTGEPVFTLAGKSGSEPGEFGYISDAVQAPNGHWFISEFGANERISCLDRAGRCISTWGQMGTAPGQFNHIRALAIGPDSCLYVADAGNHRVQVFDLNGQFLRAIGGDGDDPGCFGYPYDISFGPKGHLYVVERGHQRVQKLAIDGTPLAMWGGPGRMPGKLYSPWALAVDSRDRVHIVDTENHRVQRIRI